MIKCMIFLTLLIPSLGQTQEYKQIQYCTMSTNQSYVSDGVCKPFSINFNNIAPIFRNSGPVDPIVCCALTGRERLLNETLSVRKCYDAYFPEYSPSGAVGGVLALPNEFSFMVIYFALLNFCLLFRVGILNLQIMCIH